ncbi:DUF4282 domain-containing protein [Corynebacterium sp. MSK073]|uniref:DUF4282 domain-containing protein n=1 Tax=Corynebacterium sp. MSK073 TaxID=3050198 RepID=UPI00254A33D5|nr:DUF4282 domain-containing protein [Corynebacterium sp. MSK073]MDK8815466.1 DUF4282 domain-containing protein [Corynebacterium sp. MSK073]
MAENDRNSDAPQSFTPRDFSEQPRQNTETPESAVPKPQNDQAQKNGGQEPRAQEAKEPSTSAENAASTPGGDQPVDAGSDKSSPQDSQSSAADAESASQDHKSATDSEPSSANSAENNRRPANDAGPDAGWGTGQQSQEASAAGGYNPEAGSHPNFGQPPQGTEAPQSYGRVAGQNKRGFGAAMKGLGNKKGLLGGLWEFEFKDFMTLTHVKAIYVVGGVWWALHVLVAFILGTIVGIDGISEGEFGYVLLSFIGFIVLVLLATVVFYAGMVITRLALEALVANVRTAQNTGDLLDKES